MKIFRFLFFQILFWSYFPNNIIAQANSVNLIPPSGPNVLYPSITSAYAAIPSSLPSANNYIIELLPAYNGTDVTEVYPIQLTSKNLPPGGSTITIRPAAGNNGETIQRITPAAANTLELRGATNIILDGRPGGITSVASDYLNVIDLFATETITNYSSIRLLNGASNNIIQYINATAPQIPTTGASPGSRVISIQATPAGLPNNNNTITNNIVKGGERGIEVTGTVEYSTGNTVSNNNVSGFTSYGIFTGLLQDNTTIQNNTITFSSAIYRPAITGILLQGGVNVTNILNNTVTSNFTVPPTTTTFTGIQGTSGTGTAVNILNNTVTNLMIPAAAILNGIVTQVNGNYTISNNIGSNFYSPVATSIVGIVGAPAMPGSTFNASRNRIFSFKADGTARIVGIDLSTNSGGCTFNINNNFISITDTNANASLISGIKTILNGATPSAYTYNIFFNTIRIGGNQLGGIAGDKKAACIYKTEVFSGCILNLKNNICSMDRSGGTPGIILAGFIIDDVSGTLDIDYNTYHGSDTGTNSYATHWVSISYPNSQLAAYKLAASPNEQNSNFTNVLFQSSTDLHLSGASQTDPLLNGFPIAGITTDIDNDTRKTFIPTRGADENQLPPGVTNMRAGNWSDPTVWSNNMVPQSTDDVLIRFDIVVDINVICRSLFIRSGYNVTVNPSVTLTVLQ